MTIESQVNMMDKSSLANTRLNAKLRQIVDDTHATFVFPKNALPIKPREYVVILGISPLERYHRKNHFKTTIQLLKAVFSRLRVILIIGDWVLAESLQKENSTWSLEKCMQKAKIEADKWLVEAQQDGYLIITKPDDIDSNIANQQTVISIDEKDIIRGSDFFANGRYADDYKFAENEIINLLEDENSDAKNRINSYLGNRKQKYRNLSQSQQIWFEEKDEKFIYKEMVGQQVVIKRYPEADFVFYPGGYPLPFSVLYDNARSKDLLPANKHSWVTIKFLTERKVQDRNRLLINKINEKPKAQLNKFPKLDKKIIRSETMLPTGPQSSQNPQTLFRQKINSEEISAITETNSQSNVSTKAHEPPINLRGETVGRDENFNIKPSVVTIEVADLRDLVSMAITGLAVTNPQNLREIVSFMRNLPLHSAVSTNNNQKFNQDHNEENAQNEQADSSSQKNTLSM